MTHAEGSEDEDREYMILLAQCTSHMYALLGTWYLAPNYVDLPLGLRDRRIQLPSSLNDPPLRYSAFQQLISGESSQTCVRPFT